MKSRPTWQLAPEGRLRPATQVLVALTMLKLVAWLPDSTRPLKVNAVVPVLVSVSAALPALAPTLVLAKPRLVGVTAAAGAPTTVGLAM